MRCFGGGGDRQFSGGIECVIELLDHTVYKINVKKRAKGQLLMDEVCSHLNLFEKDYFGLRCLDSTKNAHWLDLQKGILQQIKLRSEFYYMAPQDAYGFRGSVVKFYFRVKFYTTDPCKLKEEITRYQYFLQLKRDVADGRIQCPFDTLIELGALVIQSECGDYDPEVHTAGYVSEHRLAPLQTEEFELAVAQQHARLAGHHPSACEFMYLDKIKWQDMYGVDLHLVKGAGNADYYLGLTPSGVVIYRQKTKVSVYYWPRIVGIKFKKKKFCLKVRDKNGTDTSYYFTFDSKEACKSMWKCSVEHHAFFRLTQANTSHDASVVQSFFQLGSKFRYSGRTEKEMSIQEAPRSPPQVRRMPSQKQERRRRPQSEICLPLQSDYSPPSPAHSLRPFRSSALSRSALEVPTPASLRHHLVQQGRYQHRHSIAAGTPQAIRADSLYSQNMDVGLIKAASQRDKLDLDSSFASNGDSPKSVRSDKMKFPSKLNRTDSGSEADSFYYNRRRSRTYDSPPDDKFSESHSLQLHMITHQQGSHRRGSDNDSERAAVRRRRRRQRRAGDSGSDADSIHLHRPASGLQYSESIRDESACSDLSTPTPRSRCRRHSRCCSRRHKPDDLVQYLTCKLAEVKELSSQQPHKVQGESETMESHISVSQVNRTLNIPRPANSAHNSARSTDARNEKSSANIRRPSGSYENVSYETGTMQIIPERSDIKPASDSRIPPEAELQRITVNTDRLLDSHHQHLEEMSNLTNHIKSLSLNSTSSPIRSHLSANEVSLQDKPNTAAVNDIYTPTLTAVHRTSTPNIKDLQPRTHNGETTIGNVDSRQKQLRYYAARNDSPKRCNTSSTTSSPNTMYNRYTNYNAKRCEAFILNNQTLKVSNI